MNKSASIANLAASLAKTQSELPVVKFNMTNPFLKNKYADLGALVSASVPVMGKYGLSIAQFPTSQEGRIGVTSILMHETGEFIEDTITLVPDNSKGLSANQSAGVTLTYLKRYSWAGILGLVADEDTDGDGLAHVKSESDAANAKVTEIMKTRNWSINQMEAVIELHPFEDHDDVRQVLDLSVLPEDAPTKTVQSWFKHYLASDGTTPLMKADAANQKYFEAKKKNGGK